MAADPVPAPSFLRRTLTVAAVAVGSALFLAALWYGHHALMLIFAGILLAVALRGLSDAISSRTGLPAQPTFYAVVVALLAAFGLGGWFLAPRVADQMTELSVELPQAFDRMRGRAAETEWGRRLLGDPKEEKRAEKPTDEPDEAVKLSTLPSIFGSVSRALASTLGVLGDVILVLFLAFFLAVDAGRYHEGVLRFVPPSRRAWAEDYLREAKENLRRWFLGRLTDMAYVGTLTYLGLWWLGVPLAFPLALVTALLGFIPFFGPVAATVPAALMGLTVGPATAGYVILLYLAVQLSEGNIITPLIEQRVVSIPPAMTLAAVLLLGVWFGPLGMALAVPLTILAWLLVKRLYLQDTLGEAPGPAA